ncbi:gustatory and odorant receptor 63a-like [Thrips palmi]|uniref:Gustatory receptor n=1 Tax=Thrips palmi TaxID=161013 RepID=A0A6P8ZTQ2_THRPL|nr:gustatory and odorant receptor 63a-like [Thrips palmi]
MMRQTSSEYPKPAQIHVSPVASGWTLMNFPARAPIRPGVLSAPDEKRSQPLKNSTVLSDMFAGHGIYYKIWPIGYAMALLGMLPVTFSPIRVSAHPLRSTLVYCVAVTALVLWSGFRMVQDRIAVLADSGRSLQAYIHSVLSIVSALGILLLPLLWLEVGNLYRNEATCAHLMESFPCSPKCRWSAVLSWITVVNCALLSPIFALAYVQVIAREGAADYHFFIHNHVFLLVFCVSVMFCALSHSVKNYANNLCSTVTEVLSLKCPSPKRLVLCRRAWLRLRDLTQGMVVMPFTAMFLMLFVLLMTTLGSYLCLLCLFESQVVRGIFLLILGLYFSGLLLLVCDAVHRTTAAVGDNFLRPLESFCRANEIGDAAMEEVNIFREIVASKEISVSAAGFWVINRGTLGSLAAASVSYLVILIQFRQTENTVNDAMNHTQDTISIVK